MPKRSWVWNYYTAIEDGDVECNTCKKKVKSNKCTTNMMKHLKVHNINKVPEAASMNQDVISYVDSDNKKQKIDQLILDLIIIDLQPFSIVEDKGFQNLIKFLDPKYELPSVKTLKKLLLKRYEEQKEKIKEELRTNDNICITTDTWTSINTDSFLTVTCHFVNQNFELKSYTIETCKMTENHTAIAIANKLDEIFINWDIQDKIVAMITDNAANMKASVRYLQRPTDNLPCFAHSLNLIVKKALNNISEICTLREKCRRLVTYFKLSSVAKDKLNEMQIMLGMPQHKLKLEVETRWNSTYEMFERLNEQRSAIVLVISSLKINFNKLTDTEWEILPKILPLLLPFLLVTKELSAEKKVTISKIILIKKQLSIFLNNFSENNDIEAELCLELTSQLNKYLY